MKIENESEFESFLRKKILKPLLKDCPDYVMMDSKKGVDILICRNGSEPALFFIEVKYHKHKSGRLGFGHAKGGGFQPELLMRQPDYFQENMRWILKDESQSGMLFLTNEEISQYVSNGKVEKKYNNIQRRIFKDKVQLTSLELIAEIACWLGIEKKKI